MLKQSVKFNYMGETISFGAGSVEQWLAMYVLYEGVVGTGDEGRGALDDLEPKRETGLEIVEGSQVSYV